MTQVYERITSQNIGPTLQTTRVEEIKYAPGTPNFATVSVPALTYPKWGPILWLSLITVIFAICFFVVSALAIMAATSTVTVYWPIAITSGVFIAVYTIVGAAMLFFYSRGMGRNMTLMHNYSVYAAFIITIIAGVFIFAVDINWLQRFSTCCNSDVVVISVPIVPSFMLYFVARLWDCFGYLVILIVNVAACLSNWYPFRVSDQSTITHLG